MKEKKNTLQDPEDNSVPLWMYLILAIVTIALIIIGFNLPKFQPRVQINLNDDYTTTIDDHTITVNNASNEAVRECIVDNVPKNCSDVMDDEGWIVYDFDGEKNNENGH